MEILERNFALNRIIISLKARSIKLIKRLGIRNIRAKQKKSIKLKI